MSGWLKVIALAAVLGLLLGALSPLPSSPGDTAEPEQAWTLPSAKQLSRFEIADMAAVGQLPWGFADPKEAANERRAKVVWHLRGIVSSPEQAVIVQTGDDPVTTRVGLGQALPDGATIRKIGDNQIEVEREGCRSTIQLYERGTTPETANAACERQTQERANASQ